MVQPNRRTFGVEKRPGVALKLSHSNQAPSISTACFWAACAGKSQAPKQKLMACSLPEFLEQLRGFVPAELPREKGRLHARKADLDQPPQRAPGIHLKLRAQRI
jgi:hypothetical protein